MGNKRLKRLMEEVARLADSPRNKELEMLWRPQPDVVRDAWRGTPHAMDFEEFKGIPITVEPEKPMWVKILNFDVNEFCKNPEIYLEFSLKIALYKYREFKDDTPLSKSVDIWLGSAFETRDMFGVPVEFLPGRSPWIGRDPVIRREEDLEALHYPDFYESGQMPLAHEFYDKIRKLVENYGCCHISLLDERALWNRHAHAWDGELASRHDHSPGTRAQTPRFHYRV